MKMKEIGKNIKKIKKKYRFLKFGKNYKFILCGA